MSDPILKARAGQEVLPELPEEPTADWPDGERSHFFSKLTRGIPAPELQLKKAGITSDQVNFLSLKVLSCLIIVGQA